MKSRPSLVDSLDRDDQPRRSPRASRTYRSDPSNVVSPIPCSDAAPGKPLREGDLKKWRRQDLASDVRKLRLPELDAAALYITDFDESGS